MLDKISVVKIVVKRAKHVKIVIEYQYIMISSKLKISWVVSRNVVCKKDY